MDKLDKIKNAVKKIYSEMKLFINKVRKKIQIKKKLKVFLIAVLAVIMLLVSVICIARCTGKKSLYGKVEGQSMNFDRDDTDVELDIDMDGDEIKEELSDKEGTISEQTGEGSNAEGESVSEQEGNSSYIGSGNNNSTKDDEVANKHTKDETETETETGKIVQVTGNEEYDVIYEGKKYKYNDDIMTFLILGIDKNEKVSPAKDGISGGQSDGIFLVIMNPHTKKIDIITVHRDTIARIWVYDKEGNFVQTGKAQICLQHGYGDGMEVSNERSKKAISDLFYDLPIHSVTSVNMGAIGQLNDLIGGVTLTSLETFSKDGYSFEEGKSVTLKGMAAYYYTKYRDISRHYTAGKRLERQKQYLSKAVTQTMSSVKKDVGVIVDIYKIIQDYVVTDLSVDEMTYIATESIGYSFGQIYSPEGVVDTSRKYERYYLDVDSFEQMIIKIFYEEVK